MFHVPLKLRNPEGLVVPKGPSFSRARTIRNDIDGTEILFKAPRHQKFRGSMEKHEPERYISEDKLLFRNYYDDEDVAKGREDHWRQAIFFANSWAFNGPWFTGKAASVHLCFELIKIVHYPKDVSLFHPRALEKVIGDHLSYKYARFIDEFSGGIQELNAPVNWQPLTHLPVNAVKLDVVPQVFLPHDLRRHVYFPISHNILASLLFIPHRPHGSKTKVEIDKLVDERPMLDLIDNIISSIQIKLSPKAQAQQEAALTGMDNTSLTQNYPLLKWDKISEKDKAAILALEKA